MARLNQVPRCQPKRRPATIATRAISPPQRTLALEARLPLELANRRAEIALTTDSLTALERVMVDGVTREGVIKELAKIAFAPTSDQHVRVADKRQALGTLAQIMGMVVEQRHVRVVRSIEDLSEVELKAIVNGAQQKTINGNAVDIT